MKPENLKSIISKQVDDAVHLIFANAHGVAMTTSGDITPEQQMQLDSIQEQLKTLVYNQVVQNLTPEQRDEAVHKAHCSPDACKYGEDTCPVANPIKSWNVPILRTGYGHALIAVSARTEKEAIERAIEEAGNESFSEKDAEYSAPDGAMEIE